MELPEDVKAALDERVFAHLATTMPDGSPQVSVVWIDREGDTLLFSTAEGRVKTENIRRDPRVALSFTTADDYKNYVLRGRVTRFEPDGWWLIDRLARKYWGEDYPRPEGQIRVNGEIVIDKVGVNR
jgi:PPOX class probable F420-dependent enzyme